MMCASCREVISPLDQVQVGTSFYCGPCGAFVELVDDLEEDVLDWGGPVPRDHSSHER